MTFLRLAYGDETQWNGLSKGEQDALLAQDAVLRRSGHLVAPVGSAITVRAPNGRVVTDDGPFSETRAPLAGFYLINARDANEAIQLVAKTPCPNAGGAVEVWPVEELEQPEPEEH